MPETTKSDEALPKSFFFANAPPDSPLSQEALAMRRKIAEQLAGKRSPFPKTLGEGLTYFGEKLGDTMMLRELEQREAADAAMVRKQAATAGVPGTRLTPATPPAALPGTPITPPPRPYNSTELMPPVDPRDTVTAALVPPPDDQSFTAASEPVQTQAATPPATTTPSSIVGRVPLPPPRPVRDRGTQIAELQANPALMQRLMETTAGELDKGYSPKEGQIQFQTALDRAGARGIPVSQALETYTGKGSRGYYPPEVVPRGRAALQDPERLAAFQEQVVDPVMRGGDPGREQFGFTPTGNASGGFADDRVRRGVYNRSGRLPGRGETFVQQETPQQLAMLDQGRVPPRGALAGASQDAMGAILAATQQSGTPQPIPFSQATPMGPGEPDEGTPQPQQVAQAPQPKNPAIVRPDITPLPRPAALPPQMGRVPGPLSPPVPEPAPPPLQGRPQPLRDFQLPPPPVKNDAPTPEEERAWRAIMANPTDTRIRAIWQPHIDAAKARRDAEYANDLKVWEKQVEIVTKDIEQKQQAALQQSSPAAVFDLQQKREDAARKQRDFEQLGGLTIEQAIAPVKESYAEVKNLPAASVSLANAKKALLSDPKMFTGSTAEVELAMAKLAHAAGWPLNPKIAPTEAFKNYIAGVVSSLRPMVAPGSNQSNVELAAIQQAAGAKPTLDRASIETILNSVERLNVIAAVEHQKKLLAVTGGDKNRQRVLFPTYGVPGMEHVIPDTAVRELRSHHKENPAEALEEFDSYFSTPGLAERILKSGR